VTRLSQLPILALAFISLAACDSDGITGPRGSYTDAELDYFEEIAFGAEYGGSPNAVLHRWTTNPSIHVNGTPSASDHATLTQVMGEINALTGGIRLQTTTGAGDIEIYFVPQADFPRYEPSYVPGNVGFVWLTWNQTQRITQARILVSSNLSQSNRDHVIREELTQALGLLRDSDLYPSSIFYGPPSSATTYAPIDRAVIEMLHRPEIAPGMSPNRARNILATLQRRGGPLLATGQVEPSFSRGEVGSAGSGNPECRAGSPTRC
jgi:hypothetical protein